MDWQKVRKYLRDLVISGKEAEQHLDNREEEVAPDGRAKIYGA